VSARVPAAYPDGRAERDRWLLDRRGLRNPVDPARPVAALVETEPNEEGTPEAMAVIFLANRECPWRCLMCDLWRNTLTETGPPGAIPAQIRGALEGLPPARRLKLYNAGSFFDAKAIPPVDYPAIAALVEGFDRLIVESHPTLVGSACLRLRDLLAGELEVAMGLETIHPAVLPRLNKGMDLEGFEAAADFLLRERISWRAFVLLGLPFLSPEESLQWARRSVEFALDRGATAVSIIPTRSGNGALEALQERGEFSPPPIAALESAAAFGLRLRKGRVFVDLWDLARFRRCGECFEERRERLRAMNLSQRVAPRIPCAACGGDS
jgi:archaeosine synthase beta-subunit